MALAVEQNAILVRTAQDHENRHFYKIFKGQLMTPFTGTPVSAQLFRVRGTDATDVHINEVIPDSASLASTDIFALVNVETHKIYIWVGLVSFVLIFIVLHGTLMIFLSKRPLWNSRELLL